MIPRREFGLRSLGAMLAAALASLCGVRPTRAAVIPHETKEVVTPRLSWIYRQNLNVVEDEKGDVISRHIGVELVIVTLHRMPWKKHHPGALSDPIVDSFEYRTIYSAFNRRFPTRSQSLEKTIDGLRSLLSVYKLTDEERKSLEQLFHLIRPGHEVDQRLPIAAKQFIIEWSGSPDNLV